MNVYLPVLSRAVNGQRFSLTAGNPGVGGTEFTAIQLALLLARRHPDWRIVVVNRFPCHLDPHPANVSLHLADDEAACGAWLAGQPEGVTIWLGRHVLALGPEFAGSVPGRHVVWSRHPFDPAVRMLARARARVDVVCVGESQWHSNFTRRVPVHFIQNVFMGAECDSPPPIREPPRRDVEICHLGALVPAKGFLEIAKAWRAIQSAVPSPRLHVIGGATLYGWQAGGRLIPASPEYEAELLRFIPEADIRAGRVVFHGVLGDEKFAIMRRCHLAIQNPTGLTEAFPASPLEAMAVGLPVVASDDYGMADCMRHFPELVVSRRHGIAARVAWLLADADRYAALQRRALDVAADFRDRLGSILDRWDRLLLLDRDARRRGTSTLRPDLPRYGSLATLLYRRELVPRLVRLKHRLEGRDSSEA